MNQNPELIFVVDDDPHHRRLLTVLLEDRGHSVKALETGEQCLEALEDNPSVIFLDMVMPGLGGGDTLSKIREWDSNLPVIMLTSVDDVDTAVEMIKLGAYDYMLKPFDETRLFTSLDNALRHRSLAGRVRHLQGELDRLTGADGMVGCSPAIQDVMKRVHKVESSKASVLILGESGTGKELVARAIHRNSPYADGPFVDINCSAIPETLQESELFGHKKGAFTGATETRTGKLELANGGTLFLDEVAEMSLQTQAKLLRFLQERTFERVGDHKKIRVDTRVVAATNRDLKAWVEQGKFREDLYYRLAVFPVQLPPLRERKEDIPLLAVHFLRRHGDELGKEIRSISNEAMQALTEYSWPGNVRQLENAINHAMIITTYDTIDLDCLPEEVLAGLEAPDILKDIPESKSPRAGSGLVPYHEVVTCTLKQALEATGGNIPQAAQELGISRSTFYRMLKRYGLH